MLIRDLTIQGYRCFEDFSMDGLTRVNLLVGNNNSGKTSFLEAVYLLVNQPSNQISFKTSSIGNVIREIFENRNEFSQKIEKINDQSHQFIQQDFFLDRLFYGYSKNQFNEFTIFSKNDIKIIISVCWHTKEDFLSLFYPIDKIMSDEIKGEQLLLFNSHGLIELDKPDFEPISEEEMKDKIDFSLLISSSLFVINRPINFNKVAEIWDNINLTSKEEVVIKALRIILPDVERLAFSISPGVNTVKLKIKNQQELIPLSSMGDGMNRVLILAMALVSTEKGVLLVDEIETGLHYEAQLDMWRLVFKTAQDLDVQVFATTHSWDCIAAFKEALQELEDQSVAKLFRLDSKYGKLRAVEYDAEEIRIAVNQGIEVR